MLFIVCLPGGGDREPSVGARAAVGVGGDVGAARARGRRAARP